MFDYTEYSSPVTRPIILQHLSLAALSPCFLVSTDPLVMCCFARCGVRNAPFRRTPPPPTWRTRAPQPTASHATATEGGEGSTAITALVTVEARAEVHGRSPRLLPTTGPWGNLLLVTALNTTGITTHRSAASASAECSATSEWRGFVCVWCQSDFRNFGSNSYSCYSSYSWEFGVPIYSSSSHLF